MSKKGGEDMKNVEDQFSSILNVLQLGSSNQQARVMKKKTARLASMPVGHALHVQHLHETRKQFYYCSLHQ
ncbi:Protein PAT1 [Trichinella spiralis]|uniref:Protein PAT1 n=1 Tax=Trichinella spiralis TaxID=6334 RepID=A0ABR3KWU2_TRISP